MSDVRERLRRLLFLVPYVARNPGIPLDELAQKLGVSRAGLLKELDLLTFVGRPPFQPDDYIDIHVENERVYVDLDQKLSAPPRLTAGEATALAAAGELLRPAAGSALERALEKLDRALPGNARERSREMGQRLDLRLDGPEELGELNRAVLEHREVSFDYFTHGRGATERRTVRPSELFSHRGQWYLSAWCTRREDERLFRVDRMSAVTVEEARFTPTRRPPARMPDPARDRPDVVVRFGRSAAPYILERFGSEAVEGPDGSVRVRVSGASERWLVQWVLGFAGEARVLEPAWARDAVARAALASVHSQPRREPDPAGSTAPTP